jgi:hypothetical protein
MVVGLGAFQLGKKTVVVWRSLCGASSVSLPRDLIGSETLPLPSYKNEMIPLGLPIAQPNLHKMASFFPLPSSFFLLPSSLFLLPSSFFLLPSSLFLLPSSFFPLPSSLFPLPSSFFLLLLY